MSTSKFVSICTLMVCLASAAYGQNAFDAKVIPLTVEKGFPLQVILTEKLHFEENGAVHAKLVEPVYAFDREVIPSGTEIEGKITGFEKPGKWKRISAMLGGDFTPLRAPQITFHTVVLSGGNRIPIETLALPGTEKTVGLDADKAPEKGFKNSFVSTVKQSSTGDQVKSWLWGMSPLHPQYLPAGTHMNAVLL